MEKEQLQTFVIGEKIWWRVNGDPSPQSVYIGIVLGEEVNGTVPILYYSGGLWYRSFPQVEHIDRRQEDYSKILFENRKLLMPDWFKWEL